MTVGSTGEIANISTTTLIQTDDAVKAAKKAGTLIEAYCMPGQ